MKKIISFIVIILCFLQAKTQEIHLHSASNGVFIQIPGSDQAYQSFELQRSQRGRFKTIGKLTPPETEAVFLQRYQAVKDLFPLKLRQESETLSIIWQYISQRKAIDKYLPAIVDYYKGNFIW